MTKLEMQIALQPLFIKMMGEPICGDYYYCPECGLTRFMDDENIDRCLYADSSKDKIIWCPLPIDPVNPERGLWGMVDWSKLRYEQWGPDGELAIFKLPYIQYNEDMGIPIKDHPFVVAEPETALLMALLEQEGL